MGVDQIVSCIGRLPDIVFIPNFPRAFEIDRNASMRDAIKKLAYRCRRKAEIGREVQVPFACRFRRIAVLTNDGLLETSRPDVNVALTMVMVPRMGSDQVGSYF
jgi:hypothetical protein